MSGGCPSDRLLSAAFVYSQATHIRLTAGFPNMADPVSDVFMLTSRPAAHGDVTTVTDNYLGPLIYKKINYKCPSQRKVV